ncbi:MAG TPA: hypothetical protein P5330_03160, partial [Candidatus Competibacteraceae bacterium]|nr:hypothetical protein [Candidatus Competibacteraceae bacterium]
GVLSGAIPHPGGEVTLAMQDLHALEDAYNAFMETAFHDALSRIGAQVRNGQHRPALHHAPAMRGAQL